MSRKNFEALAKALKEESATNNIIDAIAEVCADSNKLFDWEKFRTAAGYKSPILEIDYKY